MKNNKLVQRFIIRLIVTMIIATIALYPVLTLINMCPPCEAKPMWSDNGIRVSSSDKNQVCQAVVSDGNSGVIIAWIDALQGGRLLAQHISSKGSRLWGGDGIVMCNTKDCYMPCIASDGAGGAIVGYVRKGYVYTQRVDALGVVKWNNGGIKISNGGDAWHTCIVEDGLHGAVLTWLDNGGIFSQRISAAGTLLWPSDIKMSNMCPRLHKHVSASDGSGGAIIAYDAYADDTYVQRVDSAGSVCWPIDSIKLNTSDTYIRPPLVIEADGSGGAVVTWVGRKSDTYQYVFAQRVNSNGARLWTSGGIRVCTANSYQDFPTIISAGNGTFIVAFRDDRDGNWPDIRAQKISSSGNLLWDPSGVLIAPVEGCEWLQEIAADGSGGFYVVWEEGGESGGDNPGYLAPGLYMQWVDSQGRIKWNNHAELLSQNHAGAGTGVGSWRIISDNAGGSVVTWVGAYVGAYLFVQRVDRSAWPPRPATTFYFAEGTCRPNFDPYFCIQNPGSADASVTITYMKGDGTTDTQDVNVPKNSRVTVAARDKLGTGDDDAHDFSAKVECTNGQQIIAERPMYFDYKGWTGGHDVVGF